MNTCVNEASVGDSSAIYAIYDLGSKIDIFLMDTMCLHENK